MSYLVKIERDPSITDKDWNRFVNQDSYKRLPFKITTSNGSYTTQLSLLSYRSAVVIIRLIQQGADPDDIETLIELERDSCY